ncbi:extracellular solute-binding protein [bacterium]|nr:extracellular solute-binding protein [bacterium]
MEKEILKFWLMPNSGFETAEIIDTEIKEFTKKNPSIDVQYDIIPWARAWERIVEHIKNKSCPDVIQIGNSWSGTLSMFKSFADISKYKKEIIKKNSLFDVAGSSPLTSNDGNNCLPWFADIRILYYRKDILEKYHIPTEWLDTWEGIVHVCEKLKKIDAQGISPIGVSGQFEQTLVQDIACWIWNAGGDFFSRDKGEILINQKESIDGMKFYFDLINNYSSKEALLKNYSYVADNFFLRDKYALYFSNPWHLVTFLSKNNPHFSKKLHKKIGIALFPKGTLRRTTFRGGSDLAIMKSTSMFKESLELIKFLVSRQSQARYCKNIGMLPSNMKAFESIYIQNTTQKKILKESYKIGRGFPNHLYWGSMEIIVARSFSKIMKKIADNRYSHNILKKEIDYLAEQMEYVINL